LPGLLGLLQDLLDNMKVIFSGLESSGKSLRLAMEVGDIAHRNGKWFKKQCEYYDKYGQAAFMASYGYEYPIARPLASNLRFSKDFEEYYTQELGLPPIIYWENLEQLIKLSHCDVIIDEVGNYFDSRLWADLSLDVRRWLSQGAKAGVEIYGSAQDFAQVDKAFRRLVNHLFYIRKLCGSPRPSATRPPVKRIWGVCMVTELDPMGYDEDKKKMKSGGLQIPSFFWIYRQYCEMFDTTQIIKKSKLPPLRHMEQICEDPTCRLHHVPKITHV